MKTDFPYLEIDGFIVEKDINGNILLDCPINEMNYYTILLLKDRVIRCSFLKEEYDSLPKDEQNDWLKNKLKESVFEYSVSGNITWISSRISKPCYRDKEGKKISVYDLEHLLRDPDYKVIKQEKIGKYFISTVWLGVPHGMGCHYFETMVFLPPDEAENPRESLGVTLDCYRYCTQEEAVDGHQQVVNEWKKKDQKVE